MSRWATAATLTTCHPDCFMLIPDDHVRRLFSLLGDPPHDMGGPDRERNAPIRFEIDAAWDWKLNAESKSDQVLIRIETAVDLDRLPDGAYEEELLSEHYDTAYAVAEEVPK